MQELTGRQRQVLDFIVSYIDHNGYPPTQREIARHLGVSGTLPVAKHLAALEKKGHLRRDEGSRGLSLTRPAGSALSVPIAGTVRAGSLSPAVEDIQGFLAVDRSEIKGVDCFFLRVSGDSMIGAGIFDGDLALVRPQPTAENKDTVVAMVDGEATLKWFYRERDCIRLQPANPDMKAIILRPDDGEVSIVGKVIGIYRRMG
jgi:repressor LexA